MRIRNMFAEKYSRQEIMMQYNNLLRSKEIRKILHSKRIDFTEVRSKAWREQKHLKTVPSVTTEPYKESVSFGNAPAVHVCLPSSQSNVRAPATPAISLSGCCITHYARRHNTLRATHDNSQVHVGFFTGQKRRLGLPCAISTDRVQHS